MSIRTKTLLISGITIVGLIFTISAYSVRIVLDSINKLEVEQVQSKTDRTGEIIDSELEYLLTKSSDWAYWDDTYNFIVNHNQEYIATNLVPETFINLNIDSIVYLDDKGLSVYAKTYDSQTGHAASASASLITATRQISKTLLTEPLTANVTGLILTPEGPMYVAVRQILHSDNTGPSRGALLFGKNLDQKEISRIAGITKTDVEVHRMDKPLTGHDQQMAQELIAGKKTFAMTIFSNTQLAGYIIRQDIYQKNILLIDAVQHRDLYLEGLQSVKLLLVGFGLAGILFLVTVFVVLGRLVLTPLVKLRLDVDRVTESGDLHQRLADTRSRDELGALSQDLNKMLTSLEQSEHQLVNEQKKSQSYIDIVGVMIVVISIDQRVALLNKRGCELLEVTSSEAVGKNWFDTFVPEDKREQVKAVFNQLIQGKASELSSIENEIVTSSGKRRLIAWRNTVIRNESGAIVSALSSGEDITETKMSQEKILARAHELEEINKSMVGRELRMIELKKEIEELKAKLGQP